METILNKHKKKDAGDNPYLYGSTLTGVRKPWCKFYRVYKNETSVTEVLINNFQTFSTTLMKIKAACALQSSKHPAFSLPADGFMFCGFLSRIRTMEYAKAGALKYIAKLIATGEQAAIILLEYREDHYDDLNINLTETNIRKLEMALNH